MKNDNRPEPSPTHSIRFTPIKRDENGKETHGASRDIGAIVLRPDGSGFRFICRRSTDFDPGSGGVVTFRKLETERER